MSMSLQGRLAQVISTREVRHLAAAIAAPQDRLSSQMFSNAAPVISGAGAATAKTAASITYGIANGVMQVVGAGTALTALTGLNIGAGKYNVFCWFIDSAGTITVRMGTEGASAAAVKFPEFPAGKALLGFALVTYASAFTGGTTPLDTATTLYFGPVGAFDPTAVL